MKNKMRLTILFTLLILAQILSAQTFTQVFSGPYLDRVSASSIAFSDVDGDNDPDVLITGGNNSQERIAKLYTNDGTGKFTEMMGTPFDGVFFGSIAFTDVDGDNDPDVLITGTNNSDERIAKLYTNDGTGNFTEMMGTPFEGVVSSSIAFSDVDGDNDPDVLITGRNNSQEQIAKLYTNDGTGNFTEMTGTPFGGVSSSSIAFSDVDGDNDPDVLITGSGSASKLYTNDGTGNFTEMTGTPFDNVSDSSIAFSDVDDDNDPDVLITGIGSGIIISKLYTNDGTGNFTEMTGTPFDGVRFGSIAFSDVDGDNDPDVLITGENNSQDPIAKLYTNDGTGNFIEGTHFTGVVFSSIAFSDIDGDNHPDVLITGVNSSGQITKFYTNDGTVSSTDNLFLKFNLYFTPYPNPTKSNILYVSFNSTENGFAILKVYDLNGHLLSQQKESIEIGQQTISIDIASLPSGSYFIQMDNGKRIGVAKFMIQ